MMRWLFPGSQADKLLEENTALSRKVSSKLDDLIEEATTVFDRRHLPDKPLDIGERRKHAATG